MYNSTSNNFRVDSVTFQRSSHTATESQTFFLKYLWKIATPTAWQICSCAELSTSPWRLREKRGLTQRIFDFRAAGRIPVHPVYITFVVGEKRKLDSRGGNPAPLPGTHLCSPIVLPAFLYLPCSWPPFEIDFPVLPSTPHRNCYLQENVTSFQHSLIYILEYSVIQKDGLNFVRLYSLNYTRYVNDLHNIWKRRS